MKDGAIIWTRSTRAVEDGQLHSSNGSPVHAVAPAQRSITQESDSPLSKGLNRYDQRQNGSQQEGIVIGETFW